MPIMVYILLYTSIMSNKTNKKNKACAPTPKTI